MTTNTPNDRDGRLDATPPPADELDRLLRRWHDVNARAAHAGRDRLMQSIAQQRAEASGAKANNGTLKTRPAPTPLRRGGAGGGRETAVHGRRASAARALRALFVNPYTRAAASLVLLVTVAALLLPLPASPALAAEIMVPDGGRLEARDEKGQIIGPCALQHTFVAVDISGRFSRVTVRQRFANPYEHKIEAVYTFPLSHRGAVDRMTMTVGDRVVVGEVKEREEARRTYEAARRSGYVASLLEQQRPNIFTQSIANIEPGAEIVVEISYVELVQIADGVHRFDFPMVVSPRYIPGASTVSRALVPAELTIRRGIILRGPAALSVGQGEDVARLGPLHAGALQTLLTAARPIEYPGTIWWGEGEDARLPSVWHPFQAQYADGAKEIGWLYTDGTGQINGRWFYTDPALIEETGTGFSADTDQVPDASLITPMPVPPDRRAGHDIDVTVTIDTGGPAITDYSSELHRIREIEDADAARRPDRVALRLENRREIPNRDFRLEWRVDDDAIEESHFVHKVPGGLDADGGGFFTLMLQPPARVDETDIPPRELMFVLDCSGSMEGFPIEKAKEVMVRAITSMRGGDRFNVVTFNEESQVLWEAPRDNTEENRKAALAYVESRQGGGGTEMRKAVVEALRATPEGVMPRRPIDLANLPADGRAVEVAADLTDVLSTDGEHGSSHEIRVDGSLSIALKLNVEMPVVLRAEGVRLRLAGAWVTREGRRIFEVNRVEPIFDDQPGRVRYVLFITDGEVGNDHAVVGDVRSMLGTARLFSIGIGSSPNRSLLDEMAKAGRGASDFVSLEGDSAAAVERFVRRIERPVLTNIEITLGDGLEVHDTIPPLDAVPDLFDEAPLIVHGRYTNAGSGVLTIAGNTGRGRYERTVKLELPEEAPDHDVIATLWARAQVDEHMKTDSRPQVIALGEEFQIMTKYTSFVAVEKSRLTIEGRPMLVAIPIEMPQGQSWPGTFGRIGSEDLAASQGGMRKRSRRGDVVGVEQYQALARKLAKKREVAQESAAGADGLSPANVDWLGRDTEAISDLLADPGHELVDLEDARSMSLWYANEDSDDFGFIPADAVDSYFSQTDPDQPDLSSYNISFFDSSQADSTAMSLGVPALVVEGEVLLQAATAEQGRLHAKWPHQVALTRENAVGQVEVTDYGTVTLAVQDTDLAQVLEMLSIQSEKNIIVDKSGPIDGPPVAADELQLGQIEQQLAGESRTSKEEILDRFRAMHAVIADSRAEAESLEKTKGYAPGREPPEPRDLERAGQPTSDLTRYSDPTPPAPTTSTKARVPLLGDIPALGEVFRYERANGETPSFEAAYTQAAASPAPRLVAEQVVLIIAALHASGAGEDAVYVAEALAAGRPDFDLGVAIRDALVDGSIDGIERGRRADEIAEKARVRLAAVVIEQLRIARLRRVLDERLWAVEEPVLVTVLTTDVEDATLATLGGAGLAIEDHSSSIPIAVGTAAPEALVRLASLECVRRVEPLAGREAVASAD